jgi:S-(hydroxymethyl)glutathione dehydrogenase / alcohol dehydrogenase
MTAITVRRMRAAILVRQHEPLVVDDVEMPETLGVGQVLVRILVSGICGSQIGEIDGVKGPDPHLPHLLGHEACGTVLERGPGVKRIATGDRVVLHWRKAPGIDADPPLYRWRGTRLNAGWVTTFNEYAVVSENRLTPIPADVDPEIAALFGCPVTTAFGMVTRNARLTLGESIVVIGCGGVGLAVIQAAVLSGAHPIVAVDVHDPKLDLARRLGASHIVNSGGRGPAQGVRAVLGREGADVVVENTGRPELIRAAYELAASNGRTILGGVPEHGKDASIDTLPLHFGKVLTGSHGGEAEPARDIPRYLRLIAAGRLDLRPLVTDRTALERINEALQRLRNGEVIGRCLVQFEA